MSYLYWEKQAEPVQGESVTEPPAYEEPRSDPMNTPPVPQAEPVPDPQVEEKHRLDLEAQEQALRHKEELHEQKIRHSEELHALKMQTQGVPSGGASAPQGAPMPMPSTPQQSQSDLLANYVQSKLGEALCATPGKKLKSKGKGRGKAVGQGKGPVGRMADAVKSAFEGPEAEEAEEAAGNPVTMEQVREFLRQNQTPEDYELHQWAESLGVSPSAAEELIYQLAAQQVTGQPPEETVEGGPEEEKEAKELIPGGKAKGMPDSAFSPGALREGIKVEKEHTPEPAVAKEIAKDHLEEYKGYYPALAEMEKKLEARKEAGALTQAMRNKVGFAVTEEGHKWDAERAAAKQQYLEDLAAQLGEKGALGYRREGGGTDWGNFLAGLRFGEGDDPRANLRHLAYVEKKHRAGKNAWNPFGGALTPHPSEGAGATGWRFGEPGAGRRKEGGVLTEAKRDKLPKGDFVFPKQEKYPINDPAHARNALARVSQHGSPSQKAKVREAVESKYPGIGVDKKAEWHELKKAIAQHIKDHT